MQVEVISMIKVTYNRGNGTETNPIRNVSSYHLPDGKFLVEYDPTMDQWFAFQNHTANLEDIKE